MNIDQHIKQCLDNDVNFIISKNWALHQMLSAWLKITGPAHICMSTFSLCDTAIRRIDYEITQNNIITIKAVLDMSLTKRDIHKLIFVQNVIQQSNQNLNGPRLSDNHSKIIIIHNDKYKIAITTSANFNNNRKIESYTTFVNHPIFLNIFNQFNKLYEQSISI